MNIKELAFLLLIGRIGAVLFNVLVLHRQIKLFKMPTYPELRDTRILFFALAVAALSFNIIPITIDILTLAASIERSSSIVNSIGVIYSANACLASLTLSGFIWLLYRLAARTTILVDKDKYDALQKNKR